MKFNRFTITASAIAVFSAISSLAATRILDEMRMTGPVPLRAPVMNDSISPSGEKFSYSSLLKETVNIDRNKKSSAIVKSDTAGRFVFKRPADDAEMYVLETRLIPERFYKGTLKVSSPDRFEVFINGVSKAKKESIEDSISQASAKNIDLRIEPETACDINIRLLQCSGDKAEPSLTLSLEASEGYEDVATDIAPDMKRRLQIPDFTFGHRARRVSVSPDGKYLLTYIQNKPSKDKNFTYATLTDLRTGKEISNNIDYSAAWMPKGSTIYYTETSRRHDGYDIYTIDPSTMVNKLMFEGVPEADFEWSPDMSYLIYITTDEGVKEEGIMRRYVNQDDRIPGNRTRHFIKKYVPKTGVSETLTFGNHSTNPLDISPDSKKLLYITMRDLPDQYPFATNSILQLDVETLKVDTLVYNDGHLRSAVYSPDGKQVFITGGPLAFNNLGKNCGTHPIANDFDNQGYILNISDLKVTPMTKDFDPSIEGDPIWNSSDGQIYFICEEGFNNNIYRLNPKNGQFKKLDIKVESAAHFSIGNNESTWLAYTGQGYDYTGQAWALNLNSGKNTLIADPYNETVSDIEFGKSESWKFTSSDGTVIDGTVTYPPDFDPSKKYPLIVYYYGGTSPSSRTLSHPYSPHVFASRGYVTYILNPSGATGYGQEFSARHVNAWGKRTANEIIEGTKQFVKEHPFINEKKIGCLGASYGGFMTQYLQTLTDIFAAAVSHAGISNVTSYWGEGYWGYTYNSIAAAKSYPWTDPDLFTKQGSLFNADKIHTPLLLLHGTVDTNVPIGESIQLFNALKILGREVEFITVEGSDHVVTDLEQRQLWQNTIMAWFAKWLQDDPKWWDDLYPERHL